MKDKISTKKGTSIYSEQISIRWVAFCTAISIIIATVLKFDLVKYAHFQWLFIKLDYSKISFTTFQEHKDFWVNITLGLSASGIISYVSLKIPFLMKKKDEIILLEKKVCDIYLNFQNICTLLLYNKNIFTLNEKTRDLVKDWSDEDKKNLLKESIETIPKKIEEVLKHIEILKRLIKKTSFSSANINSALEIAINKVSPSMETLKKLVDEVPNMINEFNISESKEDYIYIKLILYNDIYKELYNKYCYKDIKKIFERITKKHTIYMNSFDTINRINQKLIADLEKTSQEIALIEIKTNLGQILYEETTKHLKVNMEEGFR